MEELGEAVAIVSPVAGTLASHTFAGESYCLLANELPPMGCFGMVWGWFGMVWGWFGMVWDGLGWFGDDLGWFGMVWGRLQQLL